MIRSFFFWYLSILFFFDFVKTVVVGTNAVSRATILSAVERGIPVVTQDATMLQSRGAVVYTTRVVAVPTDGLSRIKLTLFANGTAGNTLARFRTEHTLEIDQCTAVSETTRVPLAAQNYTYFKIPACPTMPNLDLLVQFYNTSCSALIHNQTISLGVLTPNYLIECITAR